MVMYQSKNGRDGRNSIDYKMLDLAQGNQILVDSFPADYGEVQWPPCTDDRFKYLFTP